MLSPARSDNAGATVGPADLHLPPTEPISIAAAPAHQHRATNDRGIIVMLVVENERELIEPEA